MIARVVEPELLDTLPPTDPRAIHSRRDLRMINRWMGNRGHLARAIVGANLKPRSIVEIGAGDGTLMLSLAEELGGAVELSLLDMQPVVAEETMARFHSTGWGVRVVPARLQEWLAAPEPKRVDLVVANLFLHHFSELELREIFGGIARVTDAFVSCDPRRWLPAVWSTSLLWVLGCNGVTRNDARISVRAGFRDRELSGFWPANSGFRLSEGAAGFASHLFVAVREGRAGSF